jgi:hypothetical protein
VATTFGENVVCVQACRKRWAPGFGRPASSSSIADSSSIAAVVSSSRPSDATCPRQSSWKRGVGRYSARRDTTLAALTSALSEPYGIDPWPGVPRSRNRRHATPFSPTVMSMLRLPSLP